MKQFKEPNTFQKKKESLIITPLSIKLNTFLKFIKIVISNTFLKKESLKELNIRLLKDKSFIPL